MERAVLQEKLISSHQAFITEIGRLSESQATASVNGKWSPVQQLEHIVKSVSLVNLAFALPPFVLRMMYGKANRVSRSYDELVAKYHVKLAQGGVSTKQFLPGSTQDRSTLIHVLNQYTQSLARRTGRFSEENLDLLILPHPLLGKLTLREMIYFTIYHVGHHHKQVADQLHPIKS